MTAPQSTGRIDTYTAHGPDHMRVRRVDYSGTAWLGGENPGAGGMVMMQNSAPATEIFYLPDGLAYRSESVGEVQLAHGIALLGTGETSYVIGSRVELVADPRGNPVHWLQVSIDYRGRVPLGVSYTVTSVCAEAAIAT